MPVVFDEVSADITEPPRGEDHAPERESAAPARIDEQVRHVLDAEQRRRQRLSDH